MTDQERILALEKALGPFADIARREELHGSTIGHDDIPDDVRGIISISSVQFLGPMMGEYRAALSLLGETGDA